MADIRCPNCGRDNPDFLDVCQFCQAPLTSDAMLQIGQSPTKKNTGELEPILPEWLRDVRKQGRESAEEEAAVSATQPQVQKDEAPDLLAGLASQSNDEDEDDIPDWLASINPVVKPKLSVPSAPEPSNDFFAQFNQSKPVPEKAGEPPKQEKPAWMPEPEPPTPEQPAKKDDLSEWFSSTSNEPDEPFSFQPGATQDMSDWASKLDSSEPAAQPAPEEKEDLGWLHSLEASARQSEPKQETDWNFGIPPVPPSSQDDLGWLTDLGTSTPAQPASSQPPQQEDLSWLNELGGTSEPATPVSPKPSANEDLSWLNDLGGTTEPAQPSASKPAQEEDLSWLNALGERPAPASSQSSKQEDLSWLNDLGGISEPVQPAASTPAPEEDLSWLSALGRTSAPDQSTLSQPSQQDDLNWLDNLGEISKPSQISPSEASSPDDLSWLNNLGGISEPAQPASTAPSASQEDLSWLSNLGGASEPAQSTSVPSSSQEDLNWLNDLGGVEPAPQPAAPTMPEGGIGEPGKPSESTSPDELDWLKSFASSSESSQPTEERSSTTQEDLDWLAGLGDASTMPGYIPAKPFGTTDELNPPQDAADETPSPVSPFVPRRTAPLNGTFFNDDMPDWLKSATEETPNLPLGTEALEQFRETPRKTLDKGLLPSKPEPFGSAQDKPAAVGSNSLSTSGESLSNQDVDSLFSMDMPDWLSKPEPEAGDISSQTAEAPARDESLAPVDLPSWVQAMRPVESVLSEAGPSIETQPTEKEGPLAGLRGVIPSAPIGSSRRPKAISLKLLATDEQQAGASLFDQILAGETTPRALETAPTVTSQNVLRWAISGILIIVLGAILMMRTQFMPVSPILPNDVTAATNAINAIPNSSSVLVVVDYEPSLAGEMEAVGAPVLNQIILAHKPQLVLLSTSPESVGLIERLLSNGYTTASEYFNLGYLPGGTAGIAGFITQPNHVIPSAAAQFNNYSAVVVLTDNSESGRTWVEQLDVAKQSDPSLANQSVILVTSAQTGPLLQPYVSSKQAAGMVNGLADAARFDEAVNAIPKEKRITRTYWDAFGIGILMAILLMIIGSAWSLVSGLRARRASGEQG